MRVFCIGYGFPPIETPGSTRMRRLVKRLSDTGFDIRMLTVGQSLSGRQDGTSCPMHESHILRVDDPLARIASGLSVNTGLVHSRGSSLNSWLARAGRIALFPDRGMPWALEARRKVASITHFAPDIVYSSSPFLSTHLAGHSYSRKLGAKWVAEFRDPVSWLPEQDETGAFRRRLLARLERLVVDNADATVTISDAFSDYFRKIYPGALIRTVPNGTDFQPEVIEAKLAQRRERLAAKKPGDPLVLVHAGALYGGAREPGPVIEATVKAAEQVDRPIRLRFIGGDSNLAAEAAEKLGAAKLVAAVGALDHAATVTETEQADGVIALLHRDPVARIGIMSKFFDYVATGNPVLVVGERRAMLSRIVEDEGAGAAREYHDVDGMAEWIAGLARNPAGPGYDAIALSRNWSADRMAQRMAAVFDEAASS